MRTLSEIIEACKDGETPTVDEMRFAICALEGLSNFDSLALMKLSVAEQNNAKKILTRSAVWQFNEHFRRWKRALARTPRDWLGDEYNPDSANVQARRLVNKKLYNKIMNQCKTEDENDKTNE